MSVPVAELRQHLQYSAWASARLVEAASGLTEEELTHDHETADKSVLGTLVHVFAADRHWLGRIEGNPPEKFIDPEVDMDLEVLRSQWPALLTRWDIWLATQTDDSIAEPLVYKDLKGREFRTPLWQIVLHVVNHGTHHRGQVSGFLRKMGHRPPAVDLIHFYRKQPPS